MKSRRVPISGVAFFVASLFALVAIITPGASATSEGIHGVSTKFVNTSVSTFETSEFADPWPPCGEMIFDGTDRKMEHIRCRSAFHISGSQSPQQVGLIQHTHVQVSTTSEVSVHKLNTPQCSGDRRIVKTVSENTLLFKVHFGYHVLTPNFEFDNLPNSKALGQINPNWLSDCIDKILQPEKRTTVWVYFTR